MKVFLFEHICGGGSLGEPIPPVFAEHGGAMLAAACADFARAGCRVTTLLDSRVNLSLKASVTVASKPLDALFDAMLDNADAALVIAPEFDGILENWLTRIERHGVRNLGCTSAAARLCGDKLALAEHLKMRGVTTPDANPVHTPFPCVIKPRFGVGCEDTYLCEDPSDIAKLPKREDWIAQRYCPGMAASVSLIVHTDHVTALPAGAQHIALGDGSPTPLYYNGGSMPLPEDMQRRAAALGSAAARAVPGLTGFVGVDLVLGERPEEDAVIEINPRLTLSYVGLQHLCRDNMAAAMLDPRAPLSWSPGPIRFDSTGRIEELART